MKVLRKHIPGESSPAIADFYERTITLNEPVYSRFDDFTQRFILHHEQGHLALNTHDELAADNYAFEALAGREPFSLRKSVDALEVSLPYTHPEHYERLRQQLRRALEWDAAHGNAAAARELERMNRYARYTDYQGSAWEDYQKQKIVEMNLKSDNTLAGSYTLNTSSIILLGVFLVCVALVGFSFRKKA
ncbi:MAG: hypothetical protein LBD91_08440 [Prevotellaceae bacterium]|jgi:hypothetical protein|nr:hypothetical protein [Prevotellaceae bacterium]